MCLFIEPARTATRLVACACLAAGCSSSPSADLVDAGATPEEAAANVEGDAQSESGQGDTGSPPTCAPGTTTGVVCSITTYCAQCINGVLWGCVCVTTPPVPQGTPYHWYCASQNQACATSADSG